MGSKLLIIGNGFDLQCGLKSSYKDFFDFRYRNHQNYIASVKEMEREYKHYYSNGSSILKWEFPLILKKNKSFMGQRSPHILKTTKELESFPDFNFWDIIFILNNEETKFWNDIENQISNVIAPKSQLDSDLRDTEKLLSIHCCFFYKNYQNIINENWSFLEFAFNELEKLEKAFSNYLKTELKNNNEYAEKSEALFYNLLNYKKLRASNSVSKILISKMDDSLINFNYTQPLNTINGFRDNTDHEVPWTKSIRRNYNVHGSLIQDDIIFGIDSSNISSESKEYIFTKTFRQLIGNYSSSINTESLIPPEKLSYIIFYGHSLSSFDYSYFQSIFDYYHIYDSNIKLVFFYNCYSETTPSSVRKDMVNRVIKLMDAYSKTLDNEDHGRNMVHKLLLEHRLSITELTESCWKN